MADSGHHEIGVGWHAGPTGRGTLSLVYSCLITIITCTWTVLHLNVAAFEDTSWQRFWRKAKWMAITILLPEVIFAKAICELRLALKDLHELDKTLSIMYQDGLEWKVWGPNLTKEISWSWKVKDYSYGLRLLYLLMGLPQPVDKAGDGVERTWSWKEHKPIVWLYELGKLYSRSKLSQPSDERAGRMTVHGLRNGSYVMGSDRSSKPTLKLPDESDRSGRRKIRSAEHKEISVGDDDSVEARKASADRQPPAASTETVEGTICQEWTITHSYLANMGGLIRLVPLSGNKFSYRVITGAELSRRFEWDCGMLPLVGLALSEDDIADKSKADWLLRSLSVLQISWLILSVLSRGVSSLPLTQFEIATLAFSVFAIATFLANWWKPKDISWPVRLQEIADGRFKMDGSVAGKAPERHRFDKRQPFLRRLWSPRDTTIIRHRKNYRTRVRNDIVDMEGNVPLMFALMAVSSLVFGGIHCSAWNFTFPSRTELILWRVVSIASAVIPVIAIIFNVLLTYFATAYTDKRLWSILRIGLSSLCPSEYLEALRKPDFVEWGKNEQRILFSQPAGHRNFAEKPATPDVPPGINWQDPLGFGRMRRFSNNLQCFLEDWNKTGNGVKRSEFLLRRITNKITQMCEYYTTSTASFWDEYEEFLTQNTCESTDRKCFYVRRIMDTVTSFLKEKKRLEMVFYHSPQVLTAITISSGFLYIAARFIILVLIFTSLRDVPLGVYEETPWTRFLPNFS